jgi:predicted nucleic acid-binding protein
VSDGTLVDTNVILDVLTDDPIWSEWSSSALAAAGRRGALIIDPIVYAEVSVRFGSAEETDAAIPERIFRRDPLPYAAGFLAGKAFVEYRRAGGARTSPLPDFYIGAHALVAGLPLLTRDAARYRTYFPEVEVIAPN